jgi:hypothetical protein
MIGNNISGAWKTQLLNAAPSPECYQKTLSLEGLTAGRADWDDVAIVISYFVVIYIYRKSLIKWLSLHYI